jgi:hypothetical protein
VKEDNDGLNSLEEQSACACAYDVQGGLFEASRGCFKVFDVYIEDSL